jgi:Kelch motif
MDDERTLAVLLNRAVDQAGGRFEPPPMTAFADRRRRRRRSALAMTAAVCAVVAVAISVTLIRASRPDPTPSPVRAGYPTTGPATARSLGEGRWSTLPAAPIEGRTGAVAAWSGTEMLVWGGSSDNPERLHSDGAAFDPTRRSWRLLPAAPLSPRTGVASVWTGRSWFVWGGVVDPNSSTTASDGAVYTPSENRWGRLPTPAITGYDEVQALWTGRLVLLISTPRIADPETVNVQAYDPAAGSWTTWPDLNLPNHHPARQVYSVTDGDHVYLWSEWSYTVSEGANQTTTHYGIDGYVLDGHRQTWTTNQLVPSVGGPIGMPIWTGREILVPASQPWTGGSSGPLRRNLTGLILDPSRAAARPIPHGPADDLLADYLWTGAALLAYNTKTYESGGTGGTVYPGQAAAWDPITTTWTRLPAAPLAGAGAVSVWTGTSLIIWGTMFPATTAGGHVETRTAGLAFGR